MATETTPKKRKPRIKYNYRVQLYEDGKYHWLYDLHMLKNPAVLFDLYWVLGITIGIFLILMLMIQACSGNFSPEDFGITFKITGVTAGIMFVLGILGYLLYAAVSGWIYTAHFILDEKGVEHIQSPRSQKVAKRIGVLTVLAGLFARRPGVVGTGMIAASNTSMGSDFLHVKKVKAIRWMDTIKVNETFSKNRVYVNKEDFDFVYDFIKAHCPNAKT